MKLCYIDENFAYFTSKPLTGEGCQWGDDWDDAPYEHNAGTPYDDDDNEITKVAWDGPLSTPCGNFGNSPYSVEMINSGAVAWLVTDSWHQGGIVAIPAGVSLEEFELLVNKAGGKVYKCS